MTVRHTVRVGQEWESNDPRRQDTRVVVSRIVGYESGADKTESLTASDDVARLDRVQVTNTRTNKKTTIRRDQFTTGARGWSLVKEAR